MLTNTIREDQIAALKAKDEKKLSVLRFLLSEIQNAQISAQKELADEDVIGLIRKEVKKLEDAALMFEKGGRADLAEDNKSQITILSGYLPAELSDEDLKTRIQQIIEENQHLFESNRNAIIGILMGKLKTEASPSRIMKVFSSL